MTWIKSVNWGWVSSWAGAWLSLVSALGYLAVKDYRKAIYFAFAFGITVTIIWR